VDLGLQDKVALVTGSWRGTGSAIAATLAREGASVLVHGFESGQADPVVEGILEAGGRAMAVSGDIATPAGCLELAEQVDAAEGRVDVLVNNYGVAEGGSWTSSQSEDWVSIYEKNVLSGVRLVQHFSPGMRERGHGRIIFLGTIGSTRPAARMPHYYASKGALSTLCVSLAKELSGTGITVNLVSPGIIATAEVRSALLRRAKKKDWGQDEQAIRRAAAEMFDNPTGRLAKTEEVADLVVFVASDRAGYINATNLRIDGGATDCAL
jgi:3-oxoacyl-[acyl-carrier protein] reductase